MVIIGEEPTVDNQNTAKRNILKQEQSICAKKSFKLSDLYGIESEVNFGYR